MLRADRHYLAPWRARQARRRSDAHTWLAFHEEYPGGVEDISGYRRVDRLLLPCSYASGPAGSAPVALVRDTIELNVPAPASLFAKP